MGADSRKGPPLPVPTDTESTTGVTESGSKAATSNQGEYLLPEDGSPVTIATKRKKHERSQSSLSANRSHTSLLIEYFEGGKGSSSEPRRPSVRVKVTPSSKGKSRSESSDHHIQITESRSSRKSSHSKRGLLTNSDRRDESPHESYASFTEGSNLTTASDPIEVEIRPRRVSSPLIPTNDNPKYVQLNPSEVSSVPADSFFDGKSSNERSIERKRSQSLPRTETSRSGDKLKAPTRQRSRSLSRERIVVQKAVEKVRRDKNERDKSDRDKSERRRKHRSRSRSVSNSELYTESIRSPRGRSSRHHDDAGASGVDLSVPNSQVSRASDRYSVRSAASKSSSINNPKLLETVEDAIRRLILPELTALKREQSKRSSQGRDLGESVTSGSAVSRDARDDESSSKRRLAERDTGVEILGKGKSASGDAGAGKLRKERGLREDNLEDTVEKRSNDRNHDLEAVAVGAGIGALTSAALDKHESQDSISEKRERRRRRKSRSRSDVNESYEDLEELAPPRMPLMSEINASDITRTSILSAETEDRPNSASLERVAQIRQVSRGLVSTTPPMQKGLDTQSIENSREPPASHNLEGGMTEYELDEHGRKVPAVQPRDATAAGEHLEAHSAETSIDTDLSNLHQYTQGYDDGYYDHGYYQHQLEVPPPLRYVPYGHDRRGLSPIQSVSGYSDDVESKQHRRDSRLTHSTGSYSSLNKSAQNKDSGRSIRSADSLGDVHGNPHDFAEVRLGGLADSELTQDSDEFKRMTTYTEESEGAATTGRDVHGLGENPGYVHTPVTVESAVASLVNESELSGNNGQYDRRASVGSFEEGSERHFTSRGNSPTKRDMPGDSAVDQEHLSQSDSPVKYTEEYDLDDQGRKIAMPKTKRKGIAGIIAANAAAVVLGRQRNKKKVDPDEIEYEERGEDTGAPLQKSFKERAMEGQGQSHILSPRHSVDVPLSDVASQEQLRMGASGVPDLENPMPEIGYGDEGSEVTTNPSIIQGPVDDDRVEVGLHEPITNPSTPRPRGSGAADAEVNGVREGGQDEEWQRDSADRKRDTLITNPYEGTSPIAAIGGGILDESAYQGFAPSKLDFQGSSPLPKDEGYISSAPNALSPGAITPDPLSSKGAGLLDPEMGEDPFYTSGHSRHLSGMSHGMGSPLYDSATGTGIDRIQSKDIVALMDHLTVRDAQRSARDTELLVTLVRTAAEMRNSFEDMKRLLADTEDVIITEVQGNTENSIKRAINGPRPQPPSAPRSLRPSSNDTVEDLPTKRRNIFRRALKGLSLKSANDLGRIEEMLEQLLGEVEGLKAEGLRVPQGSRGLDGHDEYYDELDQEGNYEQDHGYEPEGNAGTSTPSHASRSGQLSIPKSRGASATKGFDGSRISTVHEGDEDELDDHQVEASSEHQYTGNQFEDTQYESNQHLGTPVRDMARADSVPLGTPPQQQLPTGSLSNENTPKTDKSKKHKSSSSSGWIPKVSRWSETTASSVFKGFRSSGRNSGRKDAEQFADAASRSGSDLGNFAEQPDAYGDDKLHSGFSQEQIQQYNEQDRAPSPFSPEDPKYKAHRNSLNLLHPQPRPGPTHRYQTQLESKAQDFTTPMTPKSLAWDSQTSLNRLPVNANANRYSHDTDNLSPVSDGGYSHGIDEAPARPPKIPEMPPKIMASQVQKPSPLHNEQFSPAHTPYHNEGSGVYDEETPRSASRQMSGALGVPARKPVGPRSMSSASRSGGDLNREDGTVIRRNKNRDTFGSVKSHYSGESEIF
ncbi:hypothetical protein F5884DRAFT_816767 [Xylogone sp. PMI_703]|nr:hypothetical protein F5884DRAFT_816767 [Xylogone sp. PMI_703]